MTKRLFAIVLAAILAITMFTFPVAAANDETGTALTYDPNSKTITAIWQSLGDDIVRYDLTLYRDGIKVTTASITDVSKPLKYVFPNITAGGNYEVVVDGKKTNNVNAKPDATTTLGRCFVPVTSSSGSGSNKLTVVYSNNTLTASWENQSGATRYRVDYTYKANGKTYSDTRTVSTNSITFSGLTYSDLVSVKVTVGNNTGFNTTNFASWGNTSSSGSGSSTSGLTVQGNVTAQIVNGNVVGTITHYGYTTYRVGIIYGGQTVPSYSYPYNKSFTYSLSNLPSSSWQIVVQGSSNPSYDNYWQTVGTITYNYGSSGSTGTGNVSIQYYNGSYYLTWPGLTGVQYYVINYQGNGIQAGSQTVNGNTTSWNIPFTSVSNSFILAVTAVMSDGSRREIGYTGTSYGNNYPIYGNGQTAGGVVTQGSNCTVTSYSNYAYIQWVSSGASDYVVMVYRDGDTSGLTYYVSGAQTYYQIPISNTYNYNVVVYNRYNSYAPVASATVKASATSSLDNIGVKKTEIKNLRVTELNSYTTSLSWDKVSGADCYVVTYGLLNGGIAEEIPVYNNSTSATIPFGSSTAYQATVYAVTSSGRSSEVGHVYNVPGTTASNSSSKDYPSNLTAKSSNKKISLSWKAADGASSYTIYYKRATSSSWNKINQKITKTAVNISGLTNNIDYDFKVVPNKGSESGIVTIAPSASTSKTVTAKDPSSSSSSDDDVNLDDEELTVTSVSSTTKGKIKITWSNVGAPSYKIYVAEGTSNSYKPCGTYTGTSATISTFGTGSSATTFTSGKTYKVRIVRTDYTGSIKDALKACPYKSVTVK